MIIFLWLLCILLFAIGATFLIALLVRNQHTQNAIGTLINGIKEGLRGSGFNISKRKCPVELWVWQTADDAEVCEDCLERASWPPMDIADWMKEGLPRTPESETECGNNCRCQLIPYRPKKLNKHRPKY